MKHNYLKHLFTALLLLYTTVATAHDFEVGGIYYNITDAASKTVAVTYKGSYASSYSNEYTGSVVISENVTYNGIVYSVTSIGERAFDDCYGLTSITIPNSVTSIGSYAFSGSTGLKSVIIPLSVENIGSSAFSGCIGLKSVEFNAVSCTTMGSYYLFSGCTALSTVTIGENVKNIPDYAFGGCTGLTSIVIPNSVTSIGDDAFYNCTGLESVVIGNSVTSIGDVAFSHTAWYNNQPNGLVYAGKVLYEYKGTMPSNTSITIKEGTLGIADGAFWGCSGLTSITIPNSVTNIGSSAFSGCTGLKSVIIPSSVENIGSYAFSGCTGLKSVIIPSSVENIGGSAFSGCIGLKSVEFNAVNCTTMGNLNSPVFKGCTILSTVTIGENVKNIPEAAFVDCSRLTCIAIPNSVTSIGDYAFYECTSLTSIEIPNSVTNIGGYAFDGTAWYNNQPDGLVYVGKVLYEYKGTMPVNTSIVIKDSTIAVSGFAFDNCTGLTSIIIPNSVTSIGMYAFEDCTSLTSIEIPNSVTSIGYRAFYGCTGLTSIISLIPADALFEVDSYTFYNVDKNVCTLYVPVGSKSTYASTASWSEFTNIVELEPTEVTVTINQYGCATYCSPYALDFSEVEGLKAYAATGYKSNSQVVTLTRVQTAEAGIGLFLKGEPGEYVVPVIETTDEHSLNMLVGTLEPTIVNSTDGTMSNYKFTVAELDEAPMFYPFEDGTTLSAGKAYLQIPTAWLPSTAQKSLNIRFDEGETTEIDELEEENGKLKGESEKVKTIYDLSGRVVENPTSGIYIIDGKKVIIK